MLNFLPSHCRDTIECDAEHSTASCAVVFDKYGDVKLHLADMDIHKTITSNMVKYTEIQLIESNLIENNVEIFQVKKYEHLIASSPIVVFDANLPIDTMATILDICKKYQKPGEFESKNFLY